MLRRRESNLSPDSMQIDRFSFHRLACHRTLPWRLYRYVARYERYRVGGRHVLASGVDITGREVLSANPKPGIYFVEIEGIYTYKIIKVQ